MCRCGSESDVSEVSLSWFDQQQLARVYIFQYLIANTDWSMVTADGERVCCHNGTLIKTEGPMLYVPYDFDLAGLVNAPYARPHAELGITRVTERRYRGFCMDSEELRSAIIAIRENEQAIVAIINELPVITDSDKKKRIAYLGRVLAATHDEDKLIGYLEKRCKR